VEDRQGGCRRPSRNCGTRLCHRKLDFGGAVSAVRSVRSRSLRVRRFAGHGTFIVLAHYCNSSFNMDSTVEEIPPFSLKPWKTQGRRFSAPLFGAPPAGHMPHKAHQIRICYKTLNCAARMYSERELTAWMKQRTALSALRLVEAQAANA
jgi:hypothetical protein